MEIYIHIPFCKHKCKYCDFVSAPESEEFIARYFDALFREIELRKADLSGQKITTVFIGGGTPSLVDGKYVVKLMEKIRNTFDCAIDECTVECNPESITAEKLAAYKGAGVNRISIGVQTLNDNLLRYIGRIHDKITAINAILLAKSYFENVSVDLMLGLPFQSVNDVFESLNEILPLGITHVSAYGLKLEDGTLLCDMERNGMFELNEDLTADMYEYIVRRLRESGYKRYEISNFAKSGFESKHNLGYWTGIPYIGFGAAAYSYTGDRRFNNVKNMYLYVESLEKGAIPVENIENLSDDDKKEEMIMLSLRTSGGLNIDEYNNKFGADFLAEKAVAMDKHKNNISLINNTLYINEDKYYISNYILSDLI